MREESDFPSATMTFGVVLPVVICAKLALPVRLAVRCKAIPTGRAHRRFGSGFRMDPFHLSVVLLAAIFQQHPFAEVAVCFE
jgi:hypothetical protein